MDELSKHAKQELKKEERAQEQHEHHSQIKKKRYGKKIIIAIIIVAVVLLIIYAVSLKLKGPGKYDEFAKCITEKGAIFYGSFQCSYCAKQKALFGKSMQYVNYVECGALSAPPAAVCQKAGVQSYPTWKINGETSVGVLSIKDLAEATGCIA